MKVLSLFDGMSCGMIALKNLGVDVEVYDAYEIDKYAVATSKHNFPEIHHKGDVFNAVYCNGQYDLLIGGSPCTYWSIAQKNNRETEASGIGWELFAQYVRALSTVKPKYFLYENNKSMSTAIRESISNTFGFEPIMINSALVSAQNRQRLYWCGILNADGTYRKAEISLPEDRGILLKDILENGEDLTANEKSYTLIVNRPHGYNSGGVKRGKAPTLTANGSWQHNNYICKPIKVGCFPSPDGTLKNSQGMRIYSAGGKSVGIKAQGGGWGAKTGLYAIPTSKPTHEVKGGKITIKGKSYPIKLADGFYTIRKLTVKECMRLQTVPEWYSFPVSNNRAYKMLGNGWTVEVIAHILNGFLKEKMQDSQYLVKGER